MEKIVEGFKKFRNEVFGKKESFFTASRCITSSRPLHHLFGFPLDPALLPKTEPGELSASCAIGNLTFGSF